MHIRAGFEIAYDCAGPTPMLLLLSTRPERLGDLVTPQELRVAPDAPVHAYRDGFGNICHRLLAPGGRITFSSTFVIADSGLPDEAAPEAEQHAIQDLPDETLVYLLGSRYCETDHLMDIAWAEFGRIQGGWRRVQAIVDYAHNRIEFGYHHARVDRTFIGGRWYTFDARHNRPRVGRILQGYGRDATDVAISTSFGSSELALFRVITEEVQDT